MKAGGGVFLDNELKGFAVRTAALRFGGFGERTFGFIFFECHTG